MLNQLEIEMTAEGAAMPWNQPFSAQSVMDSQSRVDEPIARLISAATKIAIEKKMRGGK